MPLPSVAATWNRWFGRVPVFQGGLLSYPAGTDEDALLEAALDAGAEDVTANDDDSVDVLTLPDDFLDVKDRLVQTGYLPAAAEITMRAATGNTLDLQGAQTICDYWTPWKT